MEKVRLVFIYLTILALILGFIGVLRLSGRISGEVIKTERLYSLEEVKDNQDRESCWVTDGKNVYDLTLFLQVYPENLEDKCGGRININSFPINVRELIQSYKVGVLE
jgi:hypothetical protein